MLRKIETDWLCKQITHPSAKKIASQVASLINNGDIPSHSLLSPKIELAKALGVSLGTISNAWKILKMQKMVESSKEGIIVIGKNQSITARFCDLNAMKQPVALDVSYAPADESLLPDLAPALHHACQVPGINSHNFRTIVPALRQAVMSDWPYPAEDFTVTNGEIEALSIILKVISFEGITIAVEDPTTVGLQDILKMLPVTILPVSRDQNGPVIEELKEALKQNPIAFIFQSRTHVPTGQSISKRRLKQMENLFRSNSTLLIELDSRADISPHKAISLGEYYPDRTIHIRSFFKSHGPALALSVISASSEMIKRIQNYRGFLNAGWSSYLLQEALAWLLNDPQTHKCLIKAKKVYKSRRRSLVSALIEKGIDLPEHDGDLMNVCVPVINEELASKVYNLHGVLVSPGKASSRHSSPFIRIATTRLTDAAINQIVNATLSVMKNGLI